MFPLKDNLECKTFPYVTVTLILLNCLVTIWQTTMMAYTGSEAFHGPFWLVPAELIQSFGSGDGASVLAEVFTLFSYQFLHGGLMHLVGNMFFLYVVGRATEARFGWPTYLAFYLIGGVVAGLTHVYFNSESAIPLVGASGSVAAVIGAYMLFWPKAKIWVLIRLGPLPLPAQIPGYLFCAIWFGLQIIAVMMGDGSPVAYWAHIGGFVFGAIVAGAWYLAYPHTTICYVPMENCEESKDNKNK